MHTRDCYIDPERAAPAHSDPAPEKVQDEPARSYERGFANLIIAIANITSGPASPRPPGQVGSD
jgi:hypothetical protein